MNEVVGRLYFLDDSPIRVSEHNPSKFDRGKEQAYPLDFKNFQSLTTQLVDTAIKDESFEYSPPLEKNFELVVSYYCSLSCPYCFHNKCRSIHKKFLSDSFTKCLPEFEKCILPYVDGLQHLCFGEFYDNKPLMALYSKWRKQYKIKIGIVSNFVNYDPTFEVDTIFAVSWHKNADKEKMANNLKLASEHENKLLNDAKLRLPVDKKYGFTLDEAVKLLTTYVPPDLFKGIWLSPLDNTELIDDTQSYTDDEFFTAYSNLHKLGYKISGF